MMAWCVGKEWFVRMIGRGEWTRDGDGQVENGGGGGGGRLAGGGGVWEGDGEGNGEGNGEGSGKGWGKMVASAVVSDEGGSTPLRVEGLEVGGRRAEGWESVV